MRKGTSGAPSECSSTDWREASDELQDFLSSDYVELFDAEDGTTTPATSSRCLPLEYDCGSGSRRGSELFFESASPQNVVTLSPRRAAVRTRFSADVRVDADGRRRVDDYQVLDLVGRGAFSTVELCERRTPTQVELFALKTMRKSSLKRLKTGWGPKKNALMSVRREIAIMKRLDHPNVVTLHEVIDDDQRDRIYLVLEYVDCGPVLRPSLIPNTYEAVDEATARAAFRDILRGLEYLHFLNVLHYDVKPENILLRSDGLAKLCDFGVSKVVSGGGGGGEGASRHRTFFPPDLPEPPPRRPREDDEGVVDAATVEAAVPPAPRPRHPPPSSSSRRGRRSLRRKRSPPPIAGVKDFHATTPAFTAPELCSPRRAAHFVGGAVDVWGLGATLHAMLAGSPPFVRESDAATFDAIAFTDLDPSLATSASADPAALRVLLESTLAKDARRRMDVKAAMLAEWTNVGFEPLRPTTYRGVPPVSPEEIEAAVAGVNKLAVATRIKTAMSRLVQRTRDRLRRKKKNGRDH